MNVFSEAASLAWREHQQRQRAAVYAAVPTSSSHNNPHTYLDDFGIPTDDQHYTPLEALQEEQDFLFLPRFRNRSEWGAVANLDLFFTNLYHYYYHRGWVPLICKGVVELVTLFFTLVLSVVLFACIEWHKLALCVDEATCQPHFYDYVHPPFQQATIWNLITIMYCLIFVSYGVFAVWSFLHSLQQALNAKFVMQEKLGIADRKLRGGAVEWDEIVQKLMQLQESGEYRIAIQGYDELVVANRILRKENFFVALFNRGLIDLQIGGRTFFCSSLEWSLYFCVLNFMFNHKYQIRPAFYLDPNALKRRFMVCGIAHAVFLPFLLFFLMLHFGLQNAYDWKSTKKYLGPRQWSLPAMWQFREFNELPHFFERRMAPSYQAADAYLKLFGQSEIIMAIGRILVLIGGSLGAVLLTFAAINDAILLHVKIADWNLLWYVGVVGVCYSTGKALSSDDDGPRNIRNMFAETDAALQGIAAHTHYMLDTWTRRASDAATYKAISAMFKYKAQLFLMEVASIVVAPIILCVNLPRQAEAICEFVFAIKADIPGAGEVCGYATFDFDKYGDEAWEGRTMKGEEATGTLAESVLRTGSIEAAARHVPIPKARHGKMEKSFFSFKSNHPSWKCSSSGQNLVDRLEQYRREETAALRREQELHIEAAARQLETLAQLETRQQPSAPAPRVDESYIPKTHADPDAGAGVVRSYIPPVPEDSTLEFASSTASNASSSQGLSKLDAHDETALPFAFHQSTPRSSSSVLATAHQTTLASGSVPSSLSLGLSSELRRILNMSTLDPDVSVTASLMAGDRTAEDEERRASRQYLWLERYHAHLQSQQSQPQLSAAMSEPPYPRERRDTDDPSNLGHSIV